MPSGHEKGYPFRNQKMGFFSKRAMYVLVEWHGWYWEIDHLSNNGKILEPISVTRGEFLL